ncbi:hypothetical protein ACKI1I_46930, partial [Streptomyces turgidiscabies]|uniref:hypothetical protein n=1 Tax=Streptomyces turgidiscabies TaxID=85558 RepID=UPI0038F76F7E
MRKKIFAVAFFAAFIGGGLSAYGVYRFVNFDGNALTEATASHSIKVSDAAGYSFASEQMRESGFP